MLVHPNLEYVGKPCIIDAAQVVLELGMQALYVVMVLQGLPTCTSILMGFLVIVGISSFWVGRVN